MLLLLQTSLVRCNQSRVAVTHFLLMIRSCSSCRMYMSSSPLSLRKVSKLLRANSACLLVNDFVLAQQLHMGCCCAGFTEDHALSMEAEQMLDDDDDDLDIDKEGVSDRCAKQRLLQLLLRMHTSLSKHIVYSQCTAIDCRSIEDKDEDNQRQLLELHQCRKEERQLFKRWDKLWHVPLFPGCPSTLLQTCFGRLHSASITKTKDVVVETECRAQRQLYQPKGSLYPKSLYVMKKVRLHS